MKDDACRRALPSQAKSGFDPVEPRHVEVENRDLAARAACDAHGFEAVRGVDHDETPATSRRRVE